MTTSQVLISAKGLNYYFGNSSLQKQILFDISLEIEFGEIIILTGPSGAGKTTLLTLLGCLRTVQKGELQFLGKDLSKVSQSELVEVRRRIGYIFQGHNLLDFLTARQNVQISLDFDLSISDEVAAKEAAKMLAKVNLGDRVEYYPHQLSIGQKQRVAIARALVRHPKFIVADEPTAALDSKTGRSVIELIQALAKTQNSTVLMVTHDHRILDIADRIIHMEDGRLVKA